MLPSQKEKSPMPIKRYAGLYGALWKNSVVREMGFKINFLLWIVVELLWFALHITFIAVIYTHTDRIGDWTKWHVILLLGASHFVQQLFTAVFLNNLIAISEHVRTGRLDFLLLLPVNLRFVISLRQVDLGAFVNAASAVGVMFYAGCQLHLSPSWIQLGGFVVVCAAGLILHYSLMFVLATISFWTVRAQGIVWSYYTLFQLARVPDVAFQPGLFKIFFTFAIPMLLVANVPAKLLADRLKSPVDIVLLIGLSAGCFVLSEMAWRFALRRYTSASS
ncbi:MAG: viologen exporter family transport system permease protein [Verrucomicrobiota bacterium]|jgi:ABC-2 type transport system permease protein